MTNEDFHPPIERFQQYYDQNVEYATTLLNGTKAQLVIDQAAFDKAIAELEAFNALLLRIEAVS